MKKLFVFLILILLAASAVYAQEIAGTSWELVGIFENDQFSEIIICGAEHIFQLVCIKGRFAGASYGTFLAGGRKLNANESVSLNRGDGFYLADENNVFSIS